MHIRYKSFAEYTVKQEKNPTEQPSKGMHFLSPFIFAACDKLLDFLVAVKSQIKQLISLFFGYLAAVGVDVLTVGTLSAVP